MLEVVEKGRNVAFHAVVGSANYNLHVTHQENGLVSDKDLVCFLYPTFNDLYTGTRYKYEETSDTVDVKYHDVRQLADMLYKSNLHFLQMLFSVEVGDPSGLFQELSAMKEEVAQMNLPYLYESSMGMYNRTLANYQKQKGTPNAFKSLMTMTRVCLTLMRYRDNEFQDFASALRFEKGWERDFLLKMRAGQYTEEEAFAIAERTHKTASLLKEVYRSQPVNQGTKERLETLVNQYVKQTLWAELVD